MSSLKLWLAFLLICLTASATFAQGSDDIHYYTNTENARRIASSRTHVAVATSGGIRLYERKTDTWRTLTQSNGLTTHNVLDVAFDPTNPDRLYALCGSWRVAKPSLFLNTISLKEGRVIQETSVGEGPQTGYRGFYYFFDYRLAVTDKGVAIAPSLGDCLLFNDMTKTWQPVERDTITNLRPVPGFIPFDSWLRFEGMEGVFTTERQIVLLTTNALAVYDRTTGKDRAYRLPYGRAAEPNRYPVPNYSLPAHLRLSGSTVGWDVLETTDFYNADRRMTKYLVLSYRLQLPGGKITLVAKRAVTEAQSKHLSIPARPNQPFVPGILTDFLDDGQGSLWFTTCHHPYGLGNGVIRYDIKTKRWSYPEQGKRLPANFTRVSHVKPLTLFTTTGGQGLYEPATDTIVPVDYNTPQWERVQSANAGIYDNILDPVDKTTLLDVMAQEGPTIVYAQTRHAYNERVAPILYRIDTVAKTRTTLSDALPALKTLKVLAMAVSGDGLAFFAQDYSPEHQKDEKPPVLLLYWNRATGETRRVPTDRLPGLQHGEYNYACRMTAVAGHFWLATWEHLYHYDSTTDKWTDEGEKGKWFTDEPGALWLLQSTSYGPPTPAIYSRWTPKGWERLESIAGVPDFASTYSYSFAFDGKRFWFSGIGAISVSREALTFVPVK